MKNIVLFSLFLILFTNCQKLKMNLPDTGREIVLNGFITTDTIFNLFMSRSAYLTDLSGNSMQLLTNLDSLDVSVYENNEMIDSLYHFDYYWEHDFWYMFSYGNYRSRSVRPLPGRSYKVVAKRNGLPEASSNTTIPELVRITNIDTSRITVAPGTFYDSDTGMQFKIKFSDPADETNYYMLRMYMNTYWDPYETYYVPYNSEIIDFKCNDPIIEEKLNNVNGLESIVFSDKVINGQSHTVNVIINSLIIGNPAGYSSYSSHKKTVYFKFYSITEEYFRYIQALQVYSKKYGNPLADPVLMPSNVTGGYGMFTGAAVSTDSVIFRFE